MNKFHRFVIAISALGLMILLAQGAPAHGQDRGEAKATIGGAHVTIDYGRPLLKGRDPLKMIQPGQVWRIGANESTTLESDKALNFGGTTVPAGKHILLAHYAEPGKWSLVVSRKPWDQYEPSAKIAEAPMTVESQDKSLETLAVELSSQGQNGVIKIAWGKMRLQGSFSAAQ